MAIFNQQSSAKKDVPSFANNDAAPNPQAAQTPTPTPIRETPAAADFNPTQAAPPRAVAEAPAKESLIAADLTIEGKIEAAGQVRNAGQVTGDVNVQTDLTNEQAPKPCAGVTTEPNERREGKDGVSTSRYKWPTNSKQK